MTDTLNPCPFCGGEARYQKSGTKTNWIHTIFCCQCDANMKDAFNVEELWSDWNRRSSPRLEALERVAELARKIVPRYATSKQLREIANVTPRQDIVNNLFADILDAITTLDKLSEEK